MTLFAAGLIASLLVETVLSSAAPPDTLELRAVDGVRDPAFAILIGLTTDQHAGRSDAVRLKAAIQASGRPTKLPLELLDSVARLPWPQDSTDHAVEARFRHDLDLPVPYKILSYHPGSFRASERLLFREVGLGHRSIRHQEYEGKQLVVRDLAIDEACLYLLDSGRLEIDIDGWLDKLAGDKLDDTNVVALAVFRMNGRLFGTALGYNRNGEGRSGTLSFADDKVIYPNTPELKTVSRTMRAEMERLAPELKPAPALKKKH